MMVVGRDVVKCELNTEPDVSRRFEAADVDTCSRLSLELTNGGLLSGCRFEGHK